MESKIEIQLNKKRLLLFFFLCLAFSILGLMLFLFPNESISLFFDNPKIIKQVGFVATLFFGVGFFMILIKLIDKSAGLIINQSGIIEKTTILSIGLIEWEDITRFETIDLPSSKVLLVITDKPNKYIERASNFISQSAMKANHKKFGSPISIITNNLNIDFEDLEDLLTSEWKKAKKM